MSDLYKKRRRFAWFFRLASTYTRALTMYVFGIDVIDMLLCKKYNKQSKKALKKI